MGMLRRYELQGCADQPFETLSGGQQARFQILLLELSGATLLLLDEPTDNLDLVSAEALEAGLDRFDGTVIAVTHDRWFFRGFDRFVVFGDDCRGHRPHRVPSGLALSVRSDHTGRPYSWIVERESLRAELIDAITDEEHFVSATWSGALRGTTPPAKRVTLRPVDLKVGRRHQLSVFDGRTTDVTNLDSAELVDRLNELFEAGFASTFVRTLEADLQLSHPPGGEPRLVRHRPSATEIVVSHDRRKPRLVEETAPFLRAVGITDQHGRIKPTARGKHRQVERFVEILSHTLDDTVGGSTIHAVDLGCGSGVLTLATYHFLTEVRGHSVTMTGVDTKTDIIDRLNTTVAGLGWEGLRFEAGAIADHQPAEPPDLVIALHACDTATDDALARAVGWRSRYVVAAPCCQHDLQAQIDNAIAPAEYGPLLRHGIMRERLGDLLTDTFRAELLRAHGYRTEVIEFVSTEHTAKNVMIRAVRTDRPDRDASAAAERLAMTWGVTPALAGRIGYRP